MLEWWKSCNSAKRGGLAGAIFFLVLIVGLQLPVMAPLRDLILGKPPIQALVEFQGELKLGQKETFEFEVHNHSGQDAKIVGMSRSCGCISLLTEPTRLGSNHVFPLEVIPIDTGAFHQRITFFLDHPKQFRLNIDVIGFVKEVD